MKRYSSYSTKNASTDFSKSYEKPRLHSQHETPHRHHLTILPRKRYLSPEGRQNDTSSKHFRVPWDRDFTNKRYLSPEGRQNDTSSKHLRISWDRDFTNIDNCRASRNAFSHVKHIDSIYRSRDKPEGSYFASNYNSWAESKGSSSNTVPRATCSSLSLASTRTEQLSSSSNCKPILHLSALDANKAHGSRDLRESVTDVASDKSLYFEQDIEGLNSAVLFHDKSFLHQDASITSMLQCIHLTFKLLEKDNLLDVETADRITKHTNPLCSEEASKNSPKETLLCRRIMPIIPDALTKRCYQGICDIQTEAKHNWCSALKKLPESLKEEVSSVSVYSSTVKQARYFNVFEKETKTYSEAEILKTKENSNPLVKSHIEFVAQNWKWKKKLCYLCGMSSCGRSARFGAVCYWTRCSNCGERFHGDHNRRMACPYNSNEEILNSLLSTHLTERYSCPVSVKCLYNRKHHYRCCICSKENHFICGEAPAKHGRHSLRLRRLEGVEEVVVARCTRNFSKDFVWIDDKTAGFHISSYNWPEKRGQPNFSSCAYAGPFRSFR